MKVSIITPCFNSEKTIRNTIESVLNQTYRNIEYILIDGGSTDRTLQIIEEYRSQFGGRMKVVSEKDKGIFDAMNKGLRLSKGSLIGIINSDDFYEPDAVEKITGSMTGDIYQVIYGYCRLLRADRRAGLLKNRHENLAKEMIPHPTCFVTRKVYCDFGMFLTVFRIANDYEFMVRLYQSKKVTFTQVKQIIANFRLGGASDDAKRAARENALIAYAYKLIRFRDMAGVFYE